MIKIAPLRIGKLNASQAIAALSYEVGDLTREYGDAEDEEIKKVPVEAIKELEEFALAILKLVNIYKIMTAVPSVHEVSTMIKEN